MDYSDYITWKSKLSHYTGGICPADCFGGSSNETSNTSSLPAGRYFSDYLFYNNLTSSWQVGADSVHLGSKAGASGIGYSSIAIGESANAKNNYSIAIGKSTNVGGTNTIALNATGYTFTTNQTDSFFVTPVRPATSINVLYYDPYSKEVTYGAIPAGGNGGTATNGIPSGATKYGEYLYFNGTTWAIGSAKISIGAGAGSSAQSTGAIAIGVDAGKSNQGLNAVAIGSKAGTTSQHDNTVIINATGLEVNSEGTGRLYVKPVREAANAKSLYYDVTSGEVTFYDPYDGSGIDHVSDWSLFKAKQTVDMSGFRIGKLAAPIADTDAVTKGYLMSQLRDASDALPLGGGTMLGDIDMSGRRLLRIAEPFYDGDVTTKNYVDTRIPMGSSYGEYLYHDGVKWAIGGTSVNLGLNAGVAEVGDDTVAIGREAGQTSQGDYSVAIGARAGQSNQAEKSIIINATGVAVNADLSNALYVAPVRENMGMKAMYYNEETKEVTYGDICGTAKFPNATRYGEYLYYDSVNWVASGSKINFGLDSGRYGQSDGAVAIGWEAGKTSQSVETVAIGLGAGRSNQQDFSVAIGAYAGSIEQDSTAVAIGFSAGKQSQDKYTVAIGQMAGSFEQGLGAIAIGASAGEVGQGSNAIAIGNLSGRTSQAANSIIINATGSSMRADASGALYVKPVRERAAAKALYYDVSSGEISYSDISGGSIVGEANGGRIGTNTLYNNSYKFRRYPYGLSINDGKTVADGLATEQDTIANALAKVDDWIHSYLIAQPPAPKQLELVKKATPTSIYLALENPIQIKTAVFKKKLPLIEQVSVDICNNGINYSAFTNNLDYIPDINKIDAFVISKVPVSPAYRQIQLTVSGETVPRTFNAYYYYNQDIAASNTATNLLKFWYSNYSELTPNILTAVLPGFADGSAPGAPRLLIFSGISQGSFRADWFEPQYSDLTNGIQSSDFDSPLLFYNLKYAGIDTVRYGGGINSVVNPSEFTITGIVPTELSLPYLNTIVHPGTKYSVKVVAYNNTTPTVGPELSDTVITLYPTPPAAFSTKTLSFTTNYNYNPLTESVKLIYGNALITYIVLKSIEDINSNLIENIPIHLYTNNFEADKIINTGSNIMKLSGIYHNNAIGDVAFNEINFNGFNGSIPVSNGLTTSAEIIYSNIHDVYLQNAIENTGFYLATDAKVKIKANGILPSHEFYNIRIQQYQNNILRNSIISNLFYLDDIASVPIINNSIIEYNLSNFIKISGLYVLNTPIQLNTITDISNIASYFYIQNNLMQYTLYNDSNGIIDSIYIDDITDRSTYQITSIYTLKNTKFKYDKVKLNMNYNNVYSKGINLKIKARNLVGYSNEYNIQEKILVDTESVKNIQLYSNNIQTLTITYIAGRLNTSDSAGVFDLNSFSNFRNKYDLSQNILLNTTLQICNGKFSSKSLNINNYYLNYSSVGGLQMKYNENIDYSIIPATGYRYATFVWKVDTTTPNYMGAILFKINEIIGSVPVINDEGLFVDGNPILFYYRIENISDPNTLAQDKTTVWINGNKVNSSVESVTTYRNAQLEFNGTLGGRSSGNVSDSLKLTNNNILYTLIFPQLLNLLENNAYVYVLIGIPMNSSFAFKNIDAGLIPVI